MRVSQIKMALKYLLDAKVTPLLWGSHGIGKTESVKQYAQENNLGLVMLNLGTQEVGDLIGLPDFDTSSGYKVTQNIMPSWWPTDKNSEGIIFLDEVNRARRDVLQAVFSLVLEKRLHQHYLPEGWSIVAAANPASEDYIVTDIDDKAFISRFCNIPIFADAEDWCEYASEKKVDGTIVSFLRENPNLFKTDNGFSYDVIRPSNRSAMLLDSLKKLNPPHDMFKEFVFGILGSETGTMYLKHCDEYQTYIKGEDVLQRFSSVKGKIEEIVKSGKRLDMLVNTSEEVYNVLDATNKPSDRMIENCKKYLLTIPADNFYNLLRKLVYNEKLMDHFSNDDDIVERLKNVRDLDEVKKEKEKFEKDGKKDAA